MQRKATKNTRSSNSDERNYYRWLVDNNVCCACKKYRPVIVHHCEGATFRHNKILIGHWFVIGLCGECDRVITHGSRRVFRDTYGPQSVLWLECANDYEFQTQKIIPFDVKAAIQDWGK